MGAALVNGKRREVMKHLEDFAAEAIPTLTLSQDEYWQPADFLPDMTQPDAFEQIRALQDQAKGLSEDALAVTIGDMITEEALPSYTTWISQTDGFALNGEPRGPWGLWLGKWAAEENRHGDVLNRYLYLTGRVNMREVEVTVQNLISDGGDTQTADDPYRAFTYTSFQEKATQFSHGNLAAYARKAGDDILGRLCGYVAADENRHAKAYRLFFQKCLDTDTNDALIAFGDMMKSKITMPAMFMRERGKKMGETFKSFADIAERMSIYTPMHYTEILESLLDDWDIEHLKGLNDKAEAAQEYLCRLPERYRKIAERVAGRVSKTVNETAHTFSWFDVPTADPKSVADTA
jgi:acyl-[acyl-carrier-protein] desaturase